MTNYDLKGFFGIHFTEGFLKRYFLFYNEKESKEKFLEWKNSEKDDDKKEIPRDIELREKAEGSQFAELLYSFADSFNSVYHTIYLAAFMKVGMKNSFAENQLLDFATSNFPIIDQHEGIKLFGIPDGQLHAIGKKIRDFKDFSEGVEGFPSLVLMGMIARFDAKISSFIRVMLKHQPKSISNKEAEIDLSLVLNFEKIDDLKEYIIDQEVYKIMHSSHLDQVKYMEETFKIKISEQIDNFPKYLEVFERRNLVAHGEGIANSRYFSRCRSYGVKEDDLLKEGELISLTPKYLRDSTDTLYEFGFLLIWWLWLKVKKDEFEIAYGVAIEATYDLLVNKRYRLASRILSSVLSRVDARVAEGTLRILCINKAICEKNAENPNWRDELSRFKWDACTDNFTVVIAALDENTESVCAAMEAISSTDLRPEVRIDKEAFRSWPAFKWIRDTENFKDQFKATFGEDIAMPDHTKSREEEQ